ncbi:hypothetical protein BDY19DRAFT_950662 [Irpex rosettiformis]|uniref:Uncharacterized protein n=1 Tax=Irpex rosettiformis TaxID=378272 RepID=A0ACB8U207_9APHY|nr:hypothetical protein BDY19DRAFT_950662 [Irpex rosettiformis]
MISFKRVSGYPLTTLLIFPLLTALGCIQVVLHILPVFCRQVRCDLYLFVRPDNLLLAHHSFQHHHFIYPKSQKPYHHTSRQ